MGKNDSNFIHALSQVGVVKTEREKIDFIKNRIVTYIIANNLSFSYSEIVNFCYVIGYDVASLQGFMRRHRTYINPIKYKYHYIYHYDAVITILNSFSKLNEFVIILCYFANTNEQNSNRTKLNEIIIETVDSCETGIKVYDEAGTLRFYPPGAQFLDQALIVELLPWLSPYKSAYSSFQDALALMAKEQFTRNVLDNLRHALEMLVREKLNSKKSLENQKDVIGRHLKDSHVPPQIANMYSTLIDQYTKYQNENVKHNDRVDKREIEFMLYLTATMMRFIITADKQGG